MKLLTYTLAAVIGISFKFMYCTNMFLSSGNYCRRLKNALLLNVYFTSKIFTKWKLVI